MSNNVIYSAQDVVKNYQMNRMTIPVLKNLDVDIYEGELLAIVGHSGVGKSTLLNILGLLDTPTSGRLIYAGLQDRKERSVDLATLPPESKADVRNREFGFVFQFYHLLPDLTVLENVLLPAMIENGFARYRSRKKELVGLAETLLERVGILQRKDFSPTRLSGGERQRTAIARALMNRPRVVFCDEPTGNLDTVTGERIRELILDLNDSLGTSFVLVTHDRELAGLAHRRLTMRDGVFVREDHLEAAE